jgi:hypothetical protein
VSTGPFTISCTTDSCGSLVSTSADLSMVFPP